jgi:hypothetical protein
VIKCNFLGLNKFIDNASAGKFDSINLQTLCQKLTLKRLYGAKLGIGHKSWCIADSFTLNVSEALRIYDALCLNNY